MGEMERKSEKFKEKRENGRGNGGKLRKNARWGQGNRAMAGGSGEPMFG